MLQHEFLQDRSIPTPGDTTDGVSGTTCEDNDDRHKSTAPYGVLLLRLCLGAMFIAPAMLKWRVFPIPGTVAFFESLHLPGWFAYVTIAVELGGAACLIVGIYPRYVALLLVPVMVGTIVKVHGKNGWLFFL